MSYTKDSIVTYTFATVEFRVRNYRGVYFLSDAVKAKIAAMSVEEAKAVNREAWKQKKVNTYIANRHNNWSVSGNISLYEDSASHASVAEQVAKESYKRMMKG